MEHDTQKRVKVSELPDGYFKDRLYDIVKDPDQATVPVVAKAGGIGDWAAYLGWPGKEHVRPQYLKQWADFEKTCTFEGTRAYGDKLREAEARHIFPEIDPDSPYRH